MAERFFSAADQRIAEGASDPLTLATKAVNESVRSLAQVIEDYVLPGRNKSIALTALEDVQMRANRGIYAPPEHR